MDFDVDDHRYYINILHGYININSVESYLKKIEGVEGKLSLSILTIPNYRVYSFEHLYWMLFIAKNRFIDGINVSNSLLTECLLVLSMTDQINKIDWLLKDNTKQDIFVVILSEKEIVDEKCLSKIKTEIDLSEEKPVFKIKEALKYYNIDKKITSEDDYLKMIIENMATGNNQ